MCVNNTYIRVNDTYIYVHHVWIYVTDDKKEQKNKFIYTYKFIYTSNNNRFIYTYVCIQTELN